MYIYLKLTEDHKSGKFFKDDILKLPKAAKDAWMATGIVEESTKKEFDKWNADKQKDIQSKAKEAAKAHFEKVEAMNEKSKQAKQENKEKLENSQVQEGKEVKEDDLGNESSTNSDNGGNGASEDLLFHTLTKEDIEENSELTEGFNAGDEIEVDEQGTWLLGEDEKLIKK